MLKTFRVFIIIFCFASSVLSANFDEFGFHFQYITNNEGLSQNTVTEIVRDSDGFMWFATGNGLCRYDGYTTEVFNKPFLPSNLVRSLAESKDKKLWVATSNGLCYYDINEDVFISDHELSEVTKSLNILSVYVDSYGNLWIGTSNDGIFSLQSKDGKTEVLHLHTKNSAIPNNKVSTILQLRDGRLAIGTENGLCLYNYDRRSVVAWPYQNPDNLIIQALYETREGDLWIGTFNGAMLLNIQTGKNINFVYDAINEKGLVHGTITSFCQDISGSIYIGTLGGLEVYQPESGSFIHVPQTGPDDFTMNNGFVNCLMADDFGNVWVGTEKGGVNLFNLHQKPFHYMVHKVDNSNSLSNNTINSIYSNDHHIWVGTAGGGLNRYNWNTGQYIHFKYDVGNELSISSNFITAIYRDEKKQMWIGTWGGGVNKYMGNGTFKRFSPTVTGLSNDSINLFVSSVLYDDRGYLLIGTEGGLAILDLKSEEFIDLNADLNPVSQITEIGCMLKDRDGYIWVGTRLGLYRFLLSDLNLPYNAKEPEKQVVFFDHDPTQPSNKSLPGDYVISLHEDDDGTIWIGTYGDGLAKCTRNLQGGFEFEIINKGNNGLSNDVIYSIEQDDAGYLWLGTDNGLSRYDPISRKVTNFYTADGLLSDQFYWSASYHAESGQLFFGGIKGLNYFYPGSFPSYPFESVVTITGLKIFNQSVGVGEERYNKVVFEKSLAQTDEISLSYRDNVFSVEFAALDFFHPEKLKYKYMLEGVDKNWVEVSSLQRFATYTNLSGGSYRFRILATNSDGVWNKKEKILTITIRPPFWQENWFRVMLVILIVVIVVVYSHYHSRRLIAQKKKLETLVTERTSKIELQSVQLKKQADELLKVNIKLEQRKNLIEGQKKELEHKTDEILNQRDLLIELNEEVEKVNQMRMKFFTNISHEFRTPLTLIISPIESLITDSEIPSRIRKSLNVIYKNANRLHILIDQLLTFRKIETGNFKVQLRKGAVGGFMSSVFHAFDELANQNSIDYQFIDDTNDALVWYDAEKLENIMYNLISNAFKYTNQGGEVICKLQKMADDEVLIFTIEDNGIGINEEERAKIFDRFYRISSAALGRGTGIGLALVKDLVESMQGKITVESNAGLGSCFTLLLPCHPDKIPDSIVAKGDEKYVVDIDKKVEFVKSNIAEPTEFSAGANEGNNTGRKILIVEDNQELAGFIANSLSGDYQVLIAENGEQGCEMAKKQSPDLIISDVMMPVMDGIEMCASLKDNLFTSHIPIILLSAKALAENFVEGINTGADDYISKPFNIEVLKAKVSNLIESRKKLKMLFSSGSVSVIEDAASSISTLDDQFLAKAYEVLESKYIDPDFSVEVFSESMFISRSLLYKKLKALVDLSPNDFITVYRLKKSVDLLTSKNLSINEIAYQIGFNDPKYFSRVFKKFYKKTPSEYASL